MKINRTQSEINFTLVDKHFLEEACKCWSDGNINGVMTFMSNENHIDFIQQNFLSLLYSGSGYRLKIFLGSST